MGEVSQRHRQRLMGRLRQAVEDVETAKATAQDLLRSLFPIGAPCEWEHGSHSRRAIVTDFGHGLDLKVCSETGRVYWIDGHRLIPEAAHG